jgi:hypothetical protein
LQTHRATTISPSSWGSLCQQPPFVTGLPPPLVC